MIRYILIVVSWFLSSALCSAAGAESKKVRVGFYSIPGFQSQTVNGERSGYGYDFLQLIRRYSDMEFEYSGYGKSWAESLGMLQTGKVDVLLGALKTPERERMFEYSYPIGITDINLYVRNMDVRFRPNDYATYNGMRIGTVKSEMLDDRMKRMASRSHFSCTIVDFDDFESMFKALEDNRIDAVCAIGTHLVTGYRILESFDHESIYAIVKKGNTALLNQMNDAIMELNQAILMWPLQLYRDNYLVNSTGIMELTDSEKAFIRRHSTAENAIKVATDNDWKPYSWYEDGEFHGIIVEMLDKLMKSVGLKYEFIRGEVSSEKVFRQHPDVDLYTCFASTTQVAEDNGLVVSPTLILPSIAVISQKQTSQFLTMGLSESTPMLSNTVKNKFTYDFVTYSSTEDLIAAVKNGSVDAAMMYDYTAQSYLNLADNEKLKVEFMRSLTLPIYLVSPIGKDRELITIMTKCIDQMSQLERNNISTKYLSATEPEVGVWDFIMDHPWLPLLVLLISISGFLFEKNKRMKMLQRKDAEARKLAEEANDAKTSFLFNMSHDIRTPMNAIMGFRDLLEKNQDDPAKRADYLRKIEDASRVLLSIINNVLEMARIEKGTIELSETAWSADQFSDVIYSLFIDMMDKKGLKFTRELNVQHPYIYCDPIKLREVFINILSNAYKYTLKGGVHMQMDEIPSGKEGYVCYRTTITDTGMGMSEDFLPHIFDEFSREHNTTEAKIEGTGLGMPIVKRLVELMGGTIEVKSKKGEGSAFIITLTHRIAERENLTEYAGVSFDPEMFKGRRILLVEDNDLNAEIAMEILGEHGFVIERADNGRISCDMIKAAPANYYDLVLMDIQMPEMNGYEATRTIRNMENWDKASVPIVAMTANAFEEDKREAMRAGMNGHLSKPIDVHELIKMLARAIGGKL